MKAGAVITWENRGEWGEAMTATSGTVRHGIRGADGLTHAVEVGNTIIYVHDDRVLTIDGEPVYYCTYCDFYSRRWDGKREPGSTVYTGTRRQVVRHADDHPIGDPDEMAEPIAERAPYEGDA